MQGNNKLVISLSVIWMIVAAALAAALFLKWMDRDTFKVVFATGFVIFSVVVSVLTLGRKSGDS